MLSYNCHALICFKTPCSCNNDMSFRMLKAGKLIEYMSGQLKEMREQFKNLPTRSYTLHKGIPFTENKK